MMGMGMRLGVTPTNFDRPQYYYTCRKLVKNLLMGYFHASEHKRPEVAQLMGKILGFTREELDQVCCAPCKLSPAPPCTHYHNIPLWSFF